MFKQAAGGVSSHGSWPAKGQGPRGPRGGPAVEVDGFTLQAFFPARNWGIRFLALAVNRFSGGIGLR